MNNIELNNINEYEEEFVGYNEFDEKRKQNNIFISFTNSSNGLIIEE